MRTAKLSCVCVYVCVCVCMYVCVCVCVTTHNCHLTHWNHTTEIPTGSQQYSDRFKFFADFPKNASFKSYGVICLPRVAPAS